LTGRRQKPKAKKRRCLKKGEWAMAVLAAPVHILHGIAKYRKTGWGKLMNMPNPLDAYDMMMDWAKTLRRGAMDSSEPAEKSMRLYVEVGPLLAEHEAITRYIMETDNWALRDAFPEILTIREALEWAKREDHTATRATMENLWGLLSVNKAMRAVEDNNKASGQDAPKTKQRFIDTEEQAAAEREAFGMEAKPKKAFNVIDDSDEALAKAVAELKAELAKLSANPNAMRE
jgi:hypothetical protein